MPPADDYLRAWHARHAGSAWRIFANARDDAGLSSYERLAVTVADHCGVAGRDGAPDKLEVLDVACGGGGVLAAIAALDPQAGLTGIDMSPEELAAARNLVPNARLVEGRAERMPFDDASFDVVTSHMALMLMDDVGAVVAEIHRVLRPGGLFAATVGSGVSSDVTGPILRALRELRERLGLPLVPAFGDRRFRSADTIPDLLVGFEGFTHTLVDYPLLLDREELPAFLVEAYYGQDELPREAVARILAGFNLPDPVRWPDLLLQFQARKRR